MTKDQEEVLKQLISKHAISRGYLALVQFVFLGILAALLLVGKSQFHLAVESDPSVKGAIDASNVATAGLKELSNKVDTVISTEGKIIEGFRISHEDQEKTNNEMATLTERVAGQQGQLNRIEAKAGF